MSKQTKIIKPRKLTVEEKARKIEAEEKVRARRDEGIDCILISEVPTELKERHKEEIKKFHASSKAKETFKRLEQEKVQRDARKFDWGGDPTDDRETFQEDWWKTDALIKIANEGIKRDKKKERRAKLKNMIYTYTGRKLFKIIKNKLAEKSDEKNMIQSYIGDKYFESGLDGGKFDTIEIFVDFIYYAIEYKKWRLCITREKAEQIARSYMLENNMGNKLCCLKK